MRIASLLAIAIATATTVLTALPAAVSDLPVKDGGLVLTGRLVEPDAGGKKAGVLVVHEWWGRNAYAERRATELSALGYTALAVDLYGEAASDDFPTAVKRSKPFYEDPSLFVRRLALALAALRERASVGDGPVAAVGFCFGGSAVLQAARSGMDLKGVVSFHGGLASGAPAQPGAVKARILVCHGGADPFVPAAQVQGFAEEMLKAGADWQVVSYPGAVHAFTNPDAGKGVTNIPEGVPFAQAVKSDPAAEARSMRAMRVFLADVLGR